MSQVEKGEQQHHQVSLFTPSNCCCVAGRDSTNRLMFKIARGNMKTTACVFAVPPGEHCKDMHTTSNTVVTLLSYR